jgi:hypothetical protein
VTVERNARPIAHQGDPPELPNIAPALRRLFEAGGLRRYAIWFATGDGTFMPNEEEETSGYVVNEDGRVFFFRTSWDEATRAETLTLQEVEPRADWMEDRDYRQARDLAGVEPDPLGRLDRRR